MKGLILTNAYFNTAEAEYQPLRLKEEFSALGVEIDIKRNDFFPFSISEGKLCHALDYDFCVFWDKDKYIMRALERAGIPLFNNASAIELCDDKMLTLLSLADSGIKLPNTLPGLLCYNENESVKRETANAVIDKLGLPLIVKECYGSLGKSVYLVRSIDELIAVMERVKCRPHLFQSFISSSYGKDIRVIGIGGRAVGAMERFNPSDFRSNLGSGGSAKRVELTEKMCEITEKVMTALKLDYCGIDLLVSGDGLILCEVNSNAFFHGFEKTTGINVARAYSEHIIKRLKAL